MSSKKKEKKVLYMTEERFIEIHTSEGFSRDQARRLWNSKPYALENNQEIEERLRRTCRDVKSDPLVFFGICR